MTKIATKATAQTPEILFDSRKGELSISGKSYPENVNETYKDLFEAIKTYAISPLDKTTVNFNWLYYNTATSKIIIKLISELKIIGTTLVVNWTVQEGFDMMIEKAELIAEILNTEINIIRT